MMSCWALLNDRDRRPRARGAGLLYLSLLFFENTDLCALLSSQIQNNVKTNINEFGSAINRLIRGSKR